MSQLRMIDNAFMEVSPCGRFRSFDEWVFSFANSSHRSLSVI